MSYYETVHILSHDPEQLERAYQGALKTGQGDAFRQAIEAGRTADPDNLLYAAWYYRLRAVAATARETFVHWGWAIPLAVLNGLLFWGLSDDARFSIHLAGLGRVAPSSYMPTLVLLIGPLAALFVLA